MGLDDLHQALSLHVARERNRLRQSCRDELLKLVPVRTWTRRFRGESVCLAAAAEALEGDSIAVVIRGHVPPWAANRVVAWAHFVWLAEGRWSGELDQHIEKKLRDRIDVVSVKL